MNNTEQCHASLFAVASSLLSMKFGNARSCPTEGPRGPTDAVQVGKNRPADAVLRNTVGEVTTVYLLYILLTTISHPSFLFLQVVRSIHFPFRHLFFGRCARSPSYLSCLKSHTRIYRSAITISHGARDIGLCPTGSCSQRSSLLPLAQRCWILGAWQAGLAKVSQR